MIGTTLGRYRITAKLGEGGMGSVWRAEDTLLGRDVALKLLAPHLAVSVESRQRFIREARAASRLEHPGIAAVHDAGEADGQVFIAYQLIEGITLANRLERGPLPLAELLLLARGTAQALAHAHGREVLHRDLTAGNVMLRTDGSPVIVDFGLARTHGDVTLTSTGTTLGTAPYLAPEQWRGETGDARTDLWALGTALYYAATGRLPFGADTPEAVMYRVLNEEPARPTKARDDLPAEFERLVLRLLEKDARDRLASAGELAGAMQAIASAELEVAAEPVSGETPLARMRRWWRKQARRKLGPAQVATLVASLLVVAAGATYVVRRQLDRREPVLAVMPFRNTSADAEDTGYIGEALGSELTARLGRMGGFRVLPWETTVRFADAKRSFPDLARDLGADLLLVGHFDGDGERITVGLELVEKRRGLQRWSDRIVSTTRDLAVMQNDLAGRIAQQLAPSRGRLRQGATPPRVAQNPDAYEAYLRGMRAMHSSTLADRALAEPMIRRALELDSTLSVAWVGLGAVLVNRYFEGGRGGVADLKESQDCFERALALDSASGPALRGMVRVLMESELSMEGAMALVDSTGPWVTDEVERQLARGWACVFGSLPDEAVDAFMRVLKVDPHNQAAQYMNTIALWWSGRPSDAVEAAKSYIRQYGEDADMYAYCGAYLGATGRYDEARVFLDRSVGLYAEGTGAFAVLNLAGVLRSAGQGAQANVMLDQHIPAFEAALAAAPDNLRLHTDLANLYAARGDMVRFDVQWALVPRAIALGTRGSGAEYIYTPFVLAQVGQLQRAIKVLQTVPLDLGTPTVLLPAGVGLENVFRGERTADLVRSPQLIEARVSLKRLRAIYRKRYPWLAGMTGGALAGAERVSSRRHTP